LDKNQAGAQHACECCADSRTNETAKSTGEQCATDDDCGNDFELQARSAQRIDTFEARSLNDACNGCQTARDDKIGDTHTVNVDALQACGLGISTCCKNGVAEAGAQKEEGEEGGEEEPPQDARAIIARNKF
jgi:hypothetical protein